MQRDVSSHALIRKLHAYFSLGGRERETERERERERRVHMKPGPSSKEANAETPKVSRSGVSSAQATHGNVHLYYSLHREDVPLRFTRHLQVLQEPHKRKIRSHLQDLASKPHRGASKQQTHLETFSFHSQ